jgi:hypothetical protein
MRIRRGMKNKVNILVKRRKRNAANHRKILHKSTSEGKGCNCLCFNFELIKKYIETIQINYYYL